MHFTDEQIDALVKEGFTYSQIMLADRAYGVISGKAKDFVAKKRYSKMLLSRSRAAIGGEHGYPRNEHP